MCLLSKVILVDFHAIEEKKIFFLYRNKMNISCGGFPFKLENEASEKHRVLRSSTRSNSRSFY